MTFKQWFEETTRNERKHRRLLYLAEREAKEEQVEEESRSRWIESLANPEDDGGPERA